MADKPFVSTEDLGATPTGAIAIEPVRGDVIGQRWQLEEFIARGGMGRIWRATDLRLQETVAIKLMDPALVETDIARSRFMFEAQAAAALRGPNVVAVLDFNVDAVRGLPYMAMELLRGEDLARRLERGPLSFEQTLAIIADVCAAIGRAHRAQIIHRDLKPGNVFLLAEGAGAVAKVLDFGIAKLAPGLRAGDSPRTQTGAMLGTPDYMAPEQIENAQRVDHRADLWSIAVMTYECLTGVRPFRANSLVELIREVCFGTPVPASKLAVVPRGFDAWFERAVNHNLQRRFASAEELLEALRALDPANAGPAGSEDAKAKPERQGPKARSERPCPRPRGPGPPTPTRSTSACSRS
ncbi:MAG: serine/threonine protein kinase [Myxococcales bacterium]|nr:serine/threonine protein kinase [Myxococcales bacterium]